MRLAVTPTGIRIHRGVCVTRQSQAELLEFHPEQHQMTGVTADSCLAVVEAENAPQADALAGPPQAEARERSGAIQKLEAMPPADGLCASDVTGAPQPLMPTQRTPATAILRGLGGLKLIGRSLLEDWMLLEAVDAHATPARYPKIRRSRLTISFRRRRRI